MTKKIEFYFDFASPTTFLAFYRLKEIAEKYNAKIDYKGVLLGGVFKATGNSSPVLVPAKARYMNIDLARFAKRYDIDYALNPFFPINTLPLMRGYYAAKELGLADQYMQETFDRMWKQKANFSKPEALAELVKDLGIDETEFANLVSSDSIKNQLKETTEELVKRGGYGVPTLFLADEMYFGQDRLDFIEEELAK
jgi:2-hydroxychromene-2-carboxylate isomerase